MNLTEKMESHIADPLIQIKAMLLAKSIADNPQVIDVASQIMGTAYVMNSIIRTCPEPDLRQWVIDYYTKAIMEAQEGRRFPQ